MNIAEISQIFNDYLRNKDLKNTSERFVVLEEALNLDKHFDAESLVYHLFQQNIKISRATVYRTLDLLVDCKILKKIQFGNDSWLYEPQYKIQNHDHFKCVSCGEIIEFYDELIKKIHTDLENMYQFSISNYSHIVYGICNKCSKKGQAQS